MCIKTPTLLFSGSEQATSSSFSVFVYKMRVVAPKLHRVIKISVEFNLDMNVNDLPENNP